MEPAIHHHHHHHLPIMIDEVACSAVGSDGYASRRRGRRIPVDFSVLMLTSEYMASAFSQWITFAQENMEKELAHRE